MKIETRKPKKNIDTDQNYIDLNEELPPNPLPKAVNWEQQLGFLMHDVSRLRRIVFDGYMKPAGITRSQWWVLAYLSRHDGIIQTDLAIMLDIGKAALGGLVDRLEASAFVERRPDTDRRAKRVYLSPKGKKTVREMVAKSNEMSELILADLSYDERIKLADLLSRIKDKLLEIKGD